MTLGIITSATLNLYAIPSKIKSCTALNEKRIPFDNPVKCHARNRRSPPLCLSRALRLRFRFTKSANHDRQNRRRNLIPNACSSSSEAAEEFPLLPFPMDQVLIPSESKTIHLYEARYLALLDESLLGKKKHFVHFVLDPIGTSDSAEASFAARYGCLVLVERVEQLDVGALVSMRGIGRVTILKFAQADPYLKGIIMPKQDVVPDCANKVSSQVVKLKEALHYLNSLEIKLKASKEALLQTQIANSMKWAEKECSLDCYEAFYPSFMERVSFVAFQPISGFTQSELLKLQKEKLRAMDAKSTEERLAQSIEYVKSNISMVAAKLAIQSLESK